MAKRSFIRDIRFNKLIDLVCSFKNRTEAILKCDVTIKIDGFLN